MDLIFEYSSYTLEELNKIENDNLRNILMKEYNNAFVSTYENSFLKQLMLPYYGLSLDDVFDELEYIKSSFTSLKFFPGDFVKFYPWRSTQKSKKFFMDDLGILIMPNTSYTCYRPMIRNFTTNSCYVLKKSLKVEEASSEILPQTLQEFEVFEENILSSFEEPYVTLRQKFDTGLVLKK